MQIRLDPPNAVKPYTLEEMRNQQKHKIKGRFGDKWYEFETTTQFVSCGLIAQCEGLYELGKCVECSPPVDGETVVELTDGRRFDLPKAAESRKATSFAEKRLGLHWSQWLIGFNFSSAAIMDTKLNMLAVHFGPLTFIVSWYADKA